MVINISTRPHAALQARRLGTPLGAFGARAPAAEVMLDRLGTFAPALTAIARTVATVLGTEPAA
jgi:hypothetical protein